MVGGESAFTDRRPTLSPQKRNVSNSNRQGYARVVARAQTSFVEGGRCDWGMGKICKYRNGVFPHL